MGSPAQGLRGETAKHLSSASKERKKEEASKRFSSEKVFLLLLPTLRADTGCVFPGWGCREVGAAAAGNRL